VTAEEMKMPLIVLATLMLTACQQEDKPRRIDSDVFLRRAVVEGLTEDGADQAFVSESLTGQELFVLKCPICEPVRKGFIDYARAEPRDKPPAGKGFPKEIVEDLKKPDRASQLKAVERLVDRYVSRHYDRLKMSTEERRRMQAALEVGKKEGMQMKELGPNKGLFDFCPSCNGAAKAK
jgi:hypothetical protein